jgi:hypothetical protein
VGIDSVIKHRDVRALPLDDFEPMILGVLWRGEPSAMTARVRVSDDDAWKLLFNALPEAEASRALRIDGRADLAAPLVRARSVIV